MAGRFILFENTRPFGPEMGMLHTTNDTLYWVHNSATAELTSLFLLEYTVSRKPLG